MRRSAVLSLALLVALPAWAAAQVITLPSEPGFGFKDTPPTVPASRLIPAGDGGCRAPERFPARTVDLTRAFVHRHRPVARAGAAERRHRPADHDLPAVDVVGRSSRRHQGGHRPDRRDRRSPSAPPPWARACSRSASASSRCTTVDIDGIDLENGDLTFVFQHNNCCGPNANPGELTDLNPDFERDLLEQKVGIDIDRNVFATVVEFGLADRIDLGVVVPFVKLDMHTRVFSRILRTATPPTEAEERGNAIPDPRVRPARAQQPHDLRERALPRHRRHRRPRQGAPPQDGRGRHLGRGQRQRADRRRGRSARHRRAARRGARHLVGAVRARRRPHQRRLHHVGRFAAVLADRDGRSAVQSRRSSATTCSRCRRRSTSSAASRSRSRRGSGSRATSSPVSSATPGTSRAAAPRSRRAGPAPRRPRSRCASDLRALDPGNLTQIMAGLGMRAHIAPAAPAQLRRAAARLRRRPAAESRRGRRVLAGASDPILRGPAMRRARSNTVISRKCRRRIRRTRTRKPSRAARWCSRPATPARTSSSSRRGGSSCRWRSRRAPTPSRSATSSASGRWSTTSATRPPRR